VPSESSCGFVSACGLPSSFFFVGGFQVFTSFGVSFFSGFVFGVVLGFDVVVEFPSFFFEEGELPELVFDFGGFSTGLEVDPPPLFAVFPFPEAVSPVLFVLLLLQ
jgi:hypothetical protein